MPGDDFPVFGNQHRIGESEAFDRRGDLLNLGLAVTPRVARVRPKRSDRYVLDRGTEFSPPKAETVDSSVRAEPLKRIDARLQIR
jgi:hypothetical protein